MTRRAREGASVRRGALALAAACVVATGAASAQKPAKAPPPPVLPPDGRFLCVIGGVDATIVVKHPTIDVALKNGEKFALKYDPAHQRTLYTDGKVALRPAAHLPFDERGPEWIRGGEEYTVTRCVRAK
jgi:hypothetical protein